MDLGFTIAQGQVIPPDYTSKESIRQMYVAERRNFITERADLLGKLERRALPFFAEGGQVSPESVKPRIELVETPLQLVGEPR